MKRLLGLGQREGLLLLAALFLFGWGLTNANFNFNDLLEPRAAAQALVTGQPAYPFFGDHIPLGYAPPFIPFFIPLALLPWRVAVTVVVACSAISIVFVCRRWLDTKLGIKQLWFWPLLVSVPVFSAVSGVEISPIIGFLALSLAIWSRQKGNLLVCGVFLALGLLRTTNAIPLVVAVMAAHLGKSIELRKLLTGIALVIVPLSLVAFLWDRAWIQDYLTNLAGLNVPGLPRFVDLLWGKQFIWVLLVFVSLLGVLVVRCNKRGFDSDKASLVMAFSIWCTSVPLPYAGIFALPAIIRTASRQRLGLAALIAFAAGWLGMALFASQSLVNDLVTLSLPALAWPLGLSARDKARASG